MNRPTILAPAGNQRSFEAALRFGADAVYCGLKQNNLRAGAENFTEEELGRMIERAHAVGKTLFVPLNSFPLQEDMHGMQAQACAVADLGADAVILSDLGLIRTVHRLRPNLAIHVSTQASITNAESIRILADLGASRVVLARELSLESIAEISYALHGEVELEAFVHGAVCMAWSGRCLLSRYLNDRSANAGMCTQPCRWTYRFCDPAKPERAFELEQNERGSAVLSAHDLCMFDHLDALARAGICCFKIEGRTKSEYYVGTVTGAYRRQVERLWGNPSATTREADRLELECVSHRPYSTGFYFGSPREALGEMSDRSLEREYIGLVLQRRDDRILVAMKNRFFQGDDLEVVTPQGPVGFTVTEILSADTGERLCAASHPGMQVWVPCAHASPGDLLRGRVRNRA